MLNKYLVNGFAESMVSGPYDILWKRERERSYCFKEIVCLRFINGKTKPEKRRDFLEVSTIMARNEISHS